MASRIAGITVEIGGDTTKLSKALESVNKTIKTTQSELKDVNKLLKLDPSNTETVTQKQRMLKEAIEATKEKLTTLKTAAEQANQQFADGKITQDQYDALQREIVETEQNLKSLQEQAAVTNTTLAKIDAVGEKLQTVGSQVEGVGKKFLPVTAAVTGLGTAAVKTAADFDQEMSKVAAISGATGSDFDALREKAREMGAKTKFSASEAASAMEYMAMAGWKTGDMLDGIEGIMNLAAASGEDLATTSDIVTDALTAFGLSAADSGHFADILAAASSNANTNVSMMGETFKYCAPIAGALGFSAEDTAEAIGLMANSGIKASQAGTSLRSIMNNLAGEVTFAGKNIGEVTIATSNADGSMRSLNDILADCRVAFSGLTESEKAANAESLVGKNAMSGFLQSHLQGTHADERTGRTAVAAGQCCDLPFLAQVTVDAMLDHRDMEHLGGCGAVKILAVLESIQHPLFPCFPRKHPGFDGGEVRHDELTAFLGDEHGADELGKDIRCVAVDALHHVKAPHLYQFPCLIQRGDVVLWQILQLDIPAGIPTGTACAIELKKPSGSSIRTNTAFRRLILFNGAFRHLEPELQHIHCLGIHAVLVQLADHLRHILLAQRVHRDAALIQPCFELGH